MAKYNVTFSCGHSEDVNVYGTSWEKQLHIAHYENKGLCRECYKKQTPYISLGKSVEEEKLLIDVKRIFNFDEFDRTVGCAEVEMFYGDYKQNFVGRFETGEYNSARSSIIVYVPAQYVPAKLMEKGKKASPELLNAILIAWANDVKAAAIEVATEYMAFCTPEEKMNLEKFTEAVQTIPAKPSEVLKVFYKAVSHFKDNFLQYNYSELTSISFGTPTGALVYTLRDACREYLR